MPRALGIIVSCLALALAACSGGPSFAITVGTAQATVLRGAEVVVSIDVVRGGATGSVALSVSGVPAGVTASFGDPVLPEGVATTTLTLSVASAAIDGSADLSVTAVAGSRAASTTVNLTVESLTVTGHVVDLLGFPRGGVDVLIQGTTTTSAADGSFEIAGVAVPYDVATRAGNPDPFAHVFVGLRDADVTLFPAGTLALDNAHTTAVAGSLPAAVPVDHVAQVCVEGLTVLLYGCAEVSAGDVAYEVEVAYGGGEVAARVHALLVEVDADGRPLAYPAYGTADATLAEDATTSGVDVISVSDPSEGTIALSANVPVGFEARDVYLGARLNERFTMRLADVGNLAGTLGNFLVPILPAATYGVASEAFAVAGASMVASRYGIAAGASVSIDFAAPPVLQGPPDGATGFGIGGVLSLSAPPAGVATFALSPTVAGPAIFITTVGDQATIPDLSALGFALLPGTEHTWSVFFVHAASTPEQSGLDWFRTVAEIRASVIGGGPSPAASFGPLSTSGSRTLFTP